MRKVSPCSRDSSHTYYERTQLGSDLSKFQIRESIYHGKMLDFLLGFAQLTHLRQKHIGGGPGEIEAKDLEDEVLHPEDLPLVVRVVGDVDELPHVGRVDLLVLAGDEHRGGPDQLQLGPLD